MPTIVTARPAPAFARAMQERSAWKRLLRLLWCSLLVLLGQAAYVVYESIQRPRSSVVAWRDQAPFLGLLNILFATLRSPPQLV